MASYYYLISSLPMLKTQGEPPMDYAAFLAMCKSAVSSGVYQTLEELTAASGQGAAAVGVGRVLQGPVPGADVSAEREAGPALRHPLGPGRRHRPDGDGRR